MLYFDQSFSALYGAAQLEELRPEPNGQRYAHHAGDSESDEDCDHCLGEASRGVVKWDWSIALIWKD